MALVVVILYVTFLADAVKVGSIGLLDWGMVILFGLTTFMFARFTSAPPRRGQTLPSIVTIITIAVASLVFVLLAILRFKREEF